ncbi:galactose mutarotase-like protein [Xylariaceae sp. FL0255]|nr:galactose mutarotase-like protein [Xylariaceae sp. FL0255]
MWCLTLVKILTLVGYVSAQAPSPGPDGKYTITSSGIKAQFIAYGATLTNLFVKGKDGSDVDIVMGYDNISYYPVDPGHPVYNSIPGRYVERIGNATYTIGNTTYHTQANDGNNTLHSGTNNWSYRFWNVSAASNDSVTFTVRDEPFSEEGMPGLVLANVTYNVQGNTWSIKMEAVSPDIQSPLMLTQHTYFNLDTLKNPATDTIWDHTLYMPYSSKYLEADAGAVPTGAILTAAPGSINDFASAPNMQLGHARNDSGFETNCGPGCEGYNGYWLIDGAPANASVVTLASAFSGIQADLRTDQAGVVIYSCNYFDGTSPLKSDQGWANLTTVPRSSCVAIEATNYPDGLNHPEWGHTAAEITGPGQTYNWQSSWTFSTMQAGRPRVQNPRRGLY